MAFLTLLQQRHANTAAKASRSKGPTTRPLSLNHLQKLFRFRSSFRCFYMTRYLIRTMVVERAEQIHQMQYRRGTYSLNRQKAQQALNKVVSLTYRGVAYQKHL